VRIDPALQANSGLLHVSYVNGTNLLTADPVLINQIIGVLSDAVMQQINDCLKKVLELP